LIIKKQEKPIRIRQLEALLRRLRKNHPVYPKVANSLAKQTAGYQGQRALDFYLQYLPVENNFILHDLRLYDGIHYFQIDILIISVNFILIIEVKNIVGTLLFDPEFNQLIRFHQDKEEAFPDPLIQVERQKKLLEKWLSTHTHLKNIPIETLIVISNPSTIIKAMSRKNQIAQKVIHSPKLLNKIDDFIQLHPLEKLPIKEGKKLARFFVKKHEVLTADFLQTYEIHSSELLPGVLCLTCLIPMDRSYRTWKCQKCKTENKEAHINALKDYALLVKPVITNREARELFNITSEYVVK
jgi:hypothetical protein